jgi:hypothetical protein
LIEAARVLSKHRFPATIVYAALSGEEQGLFGGHILADYARVQGWQVEANLNNDIIGNSCSSDGVCDDANVRIFSEGLRWQGGDVLRRLVRSQGGENDSPSRNLSRFLDTLADDLSLGLDVRQIWRNDRFGRGGDHSEFLNAGFPAVRFTVAIENYNWQHQDLRTENGIEYGDTIDQMDFPYLRKVTQLNVAALAALARAPMPPEPTWKGRFDRHDADLEARAGARPILSLARTDAASGSIASKWMRISCRSGCPAHGDASNACTPQSASTIGCSASPRCGGRLGEPGRLGGAGRRVRPYTPPPPPPADTACRAAWPSRR